MALKPTLQVRQSQTLALTPQLKESIQFLQMTHLEIRQVLKSEVEANPLLKFSGESEFGEAADTAPEPDTNLEALDFEDSPVVPSSLPTLGGDDRDLENNSSAKTLRQHLESQVSLLTSDPIEKAAAIFLIDDLNDDGFLRTSLAELSDRMSVPENTLELGLALLHQCEPTGVGARNLAECFRLQLMEMGQLDADSDRILGGLSDLAATTNAEFARAHGISGEKLDKFLETLRLLSTEPGRLFEVESAHYVVPDVFVRETRGMGRVVELNPDAMPTVELDKRFMLKDDAADSKPFITKCKSRASWLRKVLDQRANTILKTASEIARVQAGFFQYGPEHIKPLTQRDVADVIAMHESTVSRVTSGKYLSCERGVFELKYFFSAGVHQDGAAQKVSARSIQTRIKQMIDGETVDNILSDAKIVERLKESDIVVARRTVTKYRETMRILSSVERRRQKKRLAKITT